MQEGIYEQLISRAIQKKLDAVGRRDYFIAHTPMDKAEATQVLSQYVQKILRHALDIIKGDDRIQKQVKLVNALITYICDELNDEAFEDDLIELEAQLLRGIITKIDAPAIDLDAYLKRITPQTRLMHSALFTGGHSEISLLTELRKEILSADRIDLLVSFIKWKGILILEQELREFTARGGKLRVLTTTYIGATDYKAVKLLAKLPNTEIRISYNEGNERLHAKAYLFWRNTGFHTAYIGSSNFSRSALTDGLEWNIKVTTNEISHIIDKFQKTFEVYWARADFEPYDEQQHGEKLQKRLKSARGGINKQATPGAYFNFSPHSYQKAILEELEAEREIHHSYKNLIVAATGTGKTIISAFDFRRYQQQHPKARLLFVAHRIEILKQALGTFQGVLRDQNFGELWGGNYTPDQYNAVFATIQTLRTQLDSIQLRANYYDFIIIDEAHHLKASSYRPLLERFTPQILLGLTATPERMDGGDITEDFNRRIASEIRLPDALNDKILCPFQYFGLSDSVDLSNVSWKNGRYDTQELTNVYTRNDVRVGQILAGLDKYVQDVDDVRALCFCVSQEHAAYMARKFQEDGRKADYLVSSSGGANRNEVKQRLVKQDINYLFVVNIFNEGVDIPEVDTILFLRPTESLTIFLQQLGRGLRLLDDYNDIKKDVLTVLDFVGNARAEYDYESRFRALVGKINHSVEKEVKDKFPNAPLGCSIVLEKKAQERILENIKQATSSGKRDIQRKIVQYEHHTNLPFTLANFLRVYNIPIARIYQSDSWSGHCNAAGKRPDFRPENNDAIHKAIKYKWLSTESICYFRFIERMAEKQFKVDLSQLNKTEQQMSLMLYYDVWAGPAGFSSLEQGIRAIGKNPHLVDEIHELMGLLSNRIKTKEITIELPYSQPLKVHGRYTRDQILAAFGMHQFKKKSSNREGVAVNNKLNTMLLFVDLKKSEEDFSPTTMYDDYAISERLFHWQSQNASRPDRGRGREYIEHKRNNKHILLFVREENKNEYKTTPGYVFLGKASYQTHYGAKPMSIHWELKEPIPGYLWQDANKLGIG